MGPRRERHEATNNTSRFPSLTGDNTRTPSLSTARRPRIRETTRSLQSTDAQGALSSTSSSENQHLDSLRQRNARRFSDNAAVAAEVKLDCVPVARELQVNKDVPASLAHSEADLSSKHREKVRTGTIGLGRATGVSRVPDKELCTSPALVSSILHKLVACVQTLERDKRYMVAQGNDSEGCNSASDATLEIWESVLAQYRQLTMTVTASSCGEIQQLATAIYEAAADACLLGGNLSFYLACQTRLLNEMYNGHERSVTASSRYAEFVSYSLLYFGVFHVDLCEIARLMRNLSKGMLLNPDIQFALSAIKATNAADGIRFLRIYKTGNVRQRTLMNPRLSSMRGVALKQLLGAYLALEKGVAFSRLGISAESELLRLLRITDPALAEYNAFTDAEFKFRLPKT